MHRIAVVQSTPRIGDIKRNARFIVDCIKKIDADMLIFGELFLSGYLPRENMHEAAQTIRSPVLKDIASVTRKEGKYAIFGAPLKDEKTQGRIYNAAILIHPDGEIDHYEKWFLPNFGPFEEKWFFAPGERLPVFETKLGRIGMEICYDIFFPEITRAYAIQGADIVVCISASPSTTRKFFETVIPARAVENATYFVYANLAGPQDKLICWGGGCVYDPRGNLLGRCRYFESDVSITEIDPALINHSRKHRPTLRDSRMESYLSIYDILAHIRG